MKNEREEGFNYWKLNYRKKFFRTLWFTPFVFLIILQLYYQSPAVPYKIIPVICLIVALIAQLFYTYV